MELFALLIVFAFFGTGIWLIVRAVRSRSAEIHFAERIERLELRLRDQQRELDALRIARTASPDREAETGHDLEDDDSDFEPIPSDTLEETPGESAPPAQPADAIPTAPSIPAHLTTSVTEVRERTAPPPIPSSAGRQEPTDPFAPLRAWFARLGPQDPDMSWEMALGSFWLPRIGAAALAIAVVFLATLAAQTFGPLFRVGVGYAVGAALLAGGWWFDRKYPLFARVLLGAGFAVTYFVTFASHFVEGARVFSNPAPSLVGMGAVVIAWAGLAHIRRSEVVAGVAVVLGHLTIALTTNALDAPGPYSIAGILALSVGGAFFLLRHGWMGVAGTSLVATYLNHFYLMASIDGAGTRTEFWVGMAIVSAYFAVHATAELLSRREGDRETPFWFRNTYVSANTLAYIALATLLLRGYEFAADWQNEFRYGLAGVLLAVGVVYLRVRRGDRLYNIYLVKAVSVATWGIAYQFDSSTLSTALAMETFVLMLSARQSRLVVTRLLAHGVAICAVVHGAITFVDLRVDAYYENWQVALDAAAIVLSLLATALLYERTDWSARSPERLPGGEEWNRTFWKLDLVSRRPASFPDEAKPIDGLQFPLAYACGAWLLFTIGAFRLVASDDRGWFVAAMALALTVGAALVRSKPYGVASLLSWAVGVVWATLSVVTDASDLQATLAIGLMAAVALATEKRYVGARDGLSLHQSPVAAYGLYGAVGWLVALYLLVDIENENLRVVVYAVSSVVALAFSVFLRRMPWAIIATAFMAIAQLLWYAEWRSDRELWFGLFGGVLLGVALAGERYLARFSVRGVPHVWQALAGIAILMWVQREVVLDWRPVLWTAGGAGLMVYAAWLRRVSGTAMGLGIIAIASLFHLLRMDHTDVALPPLILGYLAPVACWLALERATDRLGKRMAYDLPAWVGETAAGIATALLVAMLYHLRDLPNYNVTIAWTVLGFALFGLAIGFGTRIYRYAGLVVLLGLASVRVVFVDTAELETVQKAIAWGVLGIVDIVIGYGYVRFFSQSTSQAEGKNVSD